MFWVVLAVSIDQITKHLANMFLQARFIPILNFFILTFATNRGIAFGLFAGVKEIVIYLSLTIVVVISLIPTFVKLKRSTEIFLSFIVGGALGNLIDRIRFGYVIDFLTMKYWPTVFNIADMFIFFGSIFLLIELLQAELKHGKSDKESGKVNRREISGGYTSYIERRRLALRQIPNGKNSGMDIQNVYSKSDKEWRSNGQWNFEETELQGEIWGYNYLECPGETGTSGDSSREHSS